MRHASYAALGIWLFFIIVGSLLPTMPSADDVTGFAGTTLLGHALAYAVLCVLAVRAFGLRPWRHVLAAALGALLLGFAVECIQPFTGRTFDLIDMAANSAGVAFGLAAIALARSASRSG